MQETHNGANNKLDRKDDTWSFSRVGEDRTIHAGVAIVIKKEMRNDVKLVEPGGK